MRDFNRWDRPYARAASDVEHEKAIGETVALDDEQLGRVAGAAEYNPKELPVEAFIKGISGGDIEGD